MGDIKRLSVTDKEGQLIYEEYISNQVGRKGMTLWIEEGKMFVGLGVQNAFEGEIYRHVIPIDEITIKIG